MALQPGDSTFPIASRRIVQSHDEGQCRVGRIEISEFGVSPDGFRLAFGGEQALRVKELRRRPPQIGGSERRTLSGHESAVSAVAVTPDGRRAISASYDRTLKVWDLHSGSEVAAITLEGALWSVAVAPDGTTILAGDAAGNVYCLHYVEPDMTTNEGD